MWQLHMMRKPRGKWMLVDTFASVTEAARRIITIEGYPVSGVFLEMFFCTAFGNDDEAFARLEHTGRKALYVVQHTVH